MDQRTINVIYKDEQKRIIFASAILFVFVPLLGIILLTVFVINTPRQYKHITYFLFIFLAMYMGLINSTKVPFSDQQMYYEAFKMIPHRTLWQNLTGIYGIGRGYTTKEMGFGMLNVIGYYVSFGSYALYITLFTILIYMLLFDGIYKWFHYLKVEKPLFYILSAIFTLAFFTQYFNLTIHLQRQVIASVIAVYAMILMVTRGKVPWLLVILSVTLHTSVGLFLPLFFLYQFSNRFTMKQTLFILGILAIGISSMSLFASTLLELSGSSIYALKRLEGMNDAGNEGRMDIGLVMIISLPLSILSLYNIKKSSDKHHNKKSYFFLFYLCIALFSAVNPNNTMQYRYFMMSYTFIPFILPLLSYKLVYYQHIWLVAIPLFLTLRFYGTFEDIVFDYAPVEAVLTSDIFNLFNYHHIH